jgi:phage/plasmid-associated DNA primase
VEVKGVIGENDVGAAKVVFLLFPHWKFCKGILYVFDNETGLWNTDEINHLKIIGKFPEELVVLKEVYDKTGITKYEKTNKSYGTNTRLMKQLIPQLKTLCQDDSWMENGENSSLGKLLFTNGYLDLKDGKFYDSFNPDILFFGRIHKNWTVPAYEDEYEYMQDIKQRLFVNPLGEKVGNYLLLNLARGLAGDLMKRNLFGLGGTNCGKSTITNALMKSCGDYVDTFNAENLAHKNSGNDEAQLMRWVMLLKHCRLVISNEMKSNIVLNGNFIKKLSGRDPLKGREHYGNEVTFRTHFLPICFANDLPKITPFDDAVNERLRVVDFPKQFKKEPSNEFELLADPNIENEMKTNEFQMAFLRLLVKTYWDFIQNNEEEIEPEEVMRAKNDWVGIDTVDFIEAFKEDFVITNDV